MKKINLIILLSIICAVAHAGDDSPLALTQKDLTDPSARQKVLEADPAAKAANDKLKGMVGDGTNLQDSYNIASSVFGKIVQESAGNEEEVERKIMSLQANPESMATYLTAEQKEVIKTMLKGSVAEEKKTELKTEGAQK